MYEVSSTLTLRALLHYRHSIHTYVLRNSHSGILAIIFFPSHTNISLDTLKYYKGSYFYFRQCEGPGPYVAVGC